MEKFRLIDKKSEILKLLQSAQEFEFKGEIWQTLKDKRFHYKIQNIIDDEIHKIIVFQTDHKQEFNPLEDIFIRIFHRDLIFKLEAGAYISAGKKIASPYPEMAQAIESRGMSRIVMPDNIDVVVDLKPLGESTLSLKAQLVDISRGGLGILVSDVNKDFLLRNKIFKIQRINDLDLSGHNEVAVGYTKSLKRGIIKSGLILKNPLVESIFDYICKNIFSTKK